MTEASLRDRLHARQPVGPCLVGRLRQLQATLRPGPVAAVEAAASPVWRLAPVKRRLRWRSGPPPGLEVSLHRIMDPLRPASSSSRRGPA